MTCNVGDESIEITGMGKEYGRTEGRGLRYKRYKEKEEEAGKG
jgi:hypothetical protein